jgi:hypothetical protein
MYGRDAMRILKRILIYFAFISNILTAGCVVYIVMWLEALRKGWLV